MRYACKAGRGERVVFPCSRTARATSRDGAGLLLGLGYLLDGAPGRSFAYCGHRPTASARIGRPDASKSVWPLHIPYAQLTLSTFYFHYSFYKKKPSYFNFVYPRSDQNDPLFQAWDQVGLFATPTRQTIGLLAG